MPKLRLTISKHEILMKNIISVIIDGFEFEKLRYSGQAMLTQEFYSFILRNKKKITYICYSTNSVTSYKTYLHFNNCKLHNEIGPAIYSEYTWLLNFYDNKYYLNGEKLEYSIWKQRVRKIKLDKLRNL